MVKAIFAESTKTLNQKKGASESTEMPNQKHRPSPKLSPQDRRGSASSLSPGSASSDLLDPSQISKPPLERTESSSASSSPGSENSDV
ncbi:hypothetical protein FH972_003062 [Carpinus fangiana]|uniref:Uncharacterized protein n=1 Tax=Carpinus fangiana TaxID=176857 RepID=A0A5N6QJY2_9ROSI|nr:hypothetical protein FH972_003062 [Carpinus fangiana]